MAVETTALLTLDPPMDYLRFQPAPQPDFIKEEEGAKENLYYFYTTKSSITEYD